MAEIKIKGEAVEYLQNAKHALLGTVTREGIPDMRAVGGYNVDGNRNVIYIGTNVATNKVRQIQENENVFVFVQNEGQVIPNFVNYTFYGEAEILKGDEAKKAGKFIQERRPQFDFSKEGTRVLKVKIQKIKKLNLASKDQNIVVEKINA